MTDHEHKFNASLVEWHGKCGCGVWGRYSKRYRAWKEVTNPTSIKGLDTRLSRLQDPDYRHPEAKRKAFIKIDDRHNKDVQTTPEREYPAPRYFKDPGSL